MIHYIITEIILSNLKEYFIIIGIPIIVLLLISFLDGLSSINSVNIKIKEILKEIGKKDPEGFYSSSTIIICFSALIIITLLTLS